MRIRVEVCGRGFLKLPSKFSYCHQLVQLTMSTSPNTGVCYNSTAFDLPQVRSLHDLAATFPSRGRVESEVSPLEAEGVRDSAAVQEKLPSLKAVLEGTPDDLGALIEIK